MEWNLTQQPEPSTTSATHRDAIKRPKTAIQGYRAKLYALAHQGEEERTTRTTYDPYVWSVDETLFHGIETPEDDAQTSGQFFQKSPRSPIRLSRRTVSRHFRRLSAGLFPGLGENRAYWKMLEYLCFGTTIERETGRKIVSEAILAEIAGKTHLLDSKNFSGQEFLNDFSRNVVRVQVSHWNYKSGRARVIESVGFPVEFAIALRDEMFKTWHDEGRVYFVGGEAFNPKSQRKSREESRDEALKRLSDAGCAEARDLLRYMNRLPPNRFQKMLAHIGDAVLAAFKIDNEDVRNRQMSILRAIQDQPLPLYKAVSRSVRIFPFNECLLLLKREVRTALCQDWTGFDLHSAQLAIAARDWGVSEVQEFLAADQDIWDSLHQHFQIKMSQDTKAVFKTALYTIEFGGGKKRVIQVFEEGGLDASAVRHFLAHPLIVALWKARNERLHRIHCDGGAVDCFGRWIAMPYDKGRANPRSVLAQLAQARELQLLYPVVELARSTDEFMLVAWLHDGFYVDFRDATKKKRWIKHITGAVNKRAQELAIETRLELKN